MKAAALGHSWTPSEPFGLPEEPSVPISRVLAHSGETCSTVTYLFIRRRRVCSDRLEQSPTHRPGRLALDRRIGARLVVCTSREHRHHLLLVPALFSLRKAGIVVQVPFVIVVASHTTNSSFGPLASATEVLEERACICDKRPRIVDAIERQAALDQMIRAGEDLCACFEVVEHTNVAVLVALVDEGQFEGATAMTAVKDDKERATTGEVGDEVLVK